MVKLRLKRRGRTKRPYFHIVAADKRAPRDGRIIEDLGRYNPAANPSEFTYDEERVLYWLRNGAQPSDTLRSMFQKEGIMYRLHLERWGKSEEEIEQLLNEFREERAGKEQRKATRLEKQKEQLEAEEKAYKEKLAQRAKEEAAKREQEQKQKEEQAAAEAEAGETDENAGAEAQAEAETAAQEQGEAEATQDQEEAGKDEAEQAEASSDESAEAEESESSDSGEEEKKG